MWEADDWTPNPSWSIQGTKPYTHPKVEDTPEAKKAYCELLGKKPSNRVGDDLAVVGTLEDDPKYTPHFFAEDMPGIATNSPLATTPNWENLPICLGFAEDIDAWMTANRSKPCKRLLSWFWTERFNMRFIYCIANGHLGSGGYMWASSSDKADRTKKNGKLAVGFTRVTAGESCLAHSMGMTWPDSTYECSMC